ncbi:MAG: hypothetical protein AAF734_06270 [Bacteroidota bacterium]
MMFERSQRKDKSNYGASFDNENEPMGDLFVTPQISKEAVKLTNAKLADPELAQTKDPEPDPDPELETSDFHQYLKQVSGKNVLKIPITPKNMKQPIKGYKVEGAVSLSVISGKRTNTKEEFKAFDLNQHPEIRSQLNTQKGDIAGVIKTASVDFAKKNWKVSSEGSYGKLFLSLKLLLDGPQLSLSEEEQKITPLSLQIMAVGRLENPDGVTADVYGTLSISPTEETTIKKVRQIYNAATPTKKKIAKGELLRKKMLEIGKEEQKAAKKELANARRKLTRLENNNKRVLRKYVQGVLTNPDLKSEQKLARLKKLEGISSKKAEAIIKKFPKGMGKEDKITHVTRIGDKTYEKMQTSQIKGIIPEDKLTRQLKEVAEEVTQLETKLTHLTDDIAQLTSKTAVQVFEEEAFDKAHKRTVKKIIEKISARQGLKVVGRIALKVIPFVNVVMTAWDIIEIGLLLYKNIGNYATGGDQGSMIPPDREKKYQPEDKAPVGISPTVMEQINTAPDPVQRIWSSITHQGAPGNLSDTEAQRFLQIVPKNISEEQADEVIAAMLSEETESLSVALTKLQKIIAALQGTTEDTEVGEQHHLTFALYFVCF